MAIEAGARVNCVVRCKVTCPALRTKRIGATRVTLRFLGNVAPIETETAWSENDMVRYSSREMFPFLETEVANVITT